MERQITIKETSYKVAVIGSRGISQIDISPYIPLNCNLIVSGGARGVDTLAEQYATTHGIKMLVIRPEYEKYGRAAPIKRNDLIVDYADMLLAFWDGKSQGTKYTIDYALRHDKYVKVIEIKRKTL